MDKKIIKGLIDEKLETLQEQFSIIKAYEGKIPVIEIDLVMANVRDLYELFLVLQQQNTGMAQAPAAVESMSADIRETPPKTEERPVLSPEPAPEPEPEPVARQETMPQPEPEPPLRSESTAEPGGETAPPRRAPHIFNFEPVMENEPVKAPQPEKPAKITFDLFSDGSHSTLADKLKSSEERRIADKLQENQPVDLRTTIGINDKFLFINELFDGNMRIYDEGIQKLNDCTTLAQADLLLLDLKIVYNWDSESPAVKKFVELARKKFS